MSDEIEIVFTKTLKEDYQQLPKHIRRKFDKQVKFLARNPTHPSLRIHRIRDHWEF